MPGIALSNDEVDEWRTVLSDMPRAERDHWIDWITGGEFSAELFSGTYNDAVKLLEDYAERGIASPSLLRELLQEDVLNRVEVDVEVEGEAEVISLVQVRVFEKKSGI